MPEIGALFLPYRGNPRQCYRDVVLYDERKTPQGLSWQQIVLHHDGVHAARSFSVLYLVLFALAVCCCCGSPIYSCTAYSCCC